MITYPDSENFLNGFLISSELKMSVHPQHLSLALLTLAHII
jgi:hypothetical protein